MSAIILATPENITIKPRRLNLQFDGLQTNFINDNPVMSALFCSLSAVFPPGERQFIKSVRYYQDQITDKDMQTKIRAFIGQEGHHGNEHDAMNNKLQELGWRVDIITKQSKILNKITEASSPAKQLGLTVAMEHITAIIANFLMNNPDFIGKDVHPDVRKLLLWHAVEETEHKAVAFDLYQQVVGDPKIRKQQMRMVLPVFIAHMMESTALLLLKNKQLARPKAWREMLREIFGKEGMFAYIKQELRDYYREDFHPWEHNNSELANKWLQELNL